MYQPKPRKLVQAGDPVLRTPARRLSNNEILFEMIRRLIADLRYTIERKSYGVGISAPQIGESVTLSLIAVKPAPNRSNVERFEQIIVNPAYQGVGEPFGKWEDLRQRGGWKLVCSSIALRNDHGIVD